MEAKHRVRRERKVRKNMRLICANGAILPKLLAFTLPLMCSSVLQLLFNAADIIVVGNFAGDTALAAVGSNTALINLLTNFFLGLSIGANVLVVAVYGGEGRGRCQRYVHTVDAFECFQRHHSDCDRLYRSETDSDLDADTRGCTSACDNVSAHLFYRYDIHDGI